MRQIIFNAAAASILLAVFAVAVSAQDGKVFTHTDGGIQFTVPANWAGEPDGDSIVLSSADGAVGVMLYVLDAETLSIAAEALDAEIGKLVSDAEVSDQTEKITINGLEAFASTGKGKVEGVPVDFIVMIVMGRKPLMIFAAAESASFDKNKPQIDELMKSIGPIK